MEIIIVVEDKRSRRGYGYRRKEIETKEEGIEWAKKHKNLYSRDITIIHNGIAENIHLKGIKLIWEEK